jgi:hypothetical protein
MTFVKKLRLAVKNSAEAAENITENNNTANPACIAAGTNPLLTTNKQLTPITAAKRFLAHFSPFNVNAAAKIACNAKAKRKYGPPSKNINAPDNPCRNNPSGPTSNRKSRLNNSETASDSPKNCNPNKTPTLADAAKMHHQLTRVKRTGRDLFMTKPDKKHLTRRSSPPELQLVAARQAPSLHPPPPQIRRKLPRKTVQREHPPRRHPLNQPH